MRVNIDFYNKQECSGTVEHEGKEYSWHYEDIELMVESLEEEIPDEVYAAIRAAIANAEADDIDLDVRFGNRC